MSIWGEHPIFEVYPKTGTQQKNLAGGGEMQRDRIAIAANWLATGGILNQNHPIPQFAPLVDWVKQQSNPTPKATCEQ